MNTSSVLAGANGHIPEPTHLGFASDVLESIRDVAPNTALTILLQRAGIRQSTLDLLQSNPERARRILTAETRRNIAKIAHALGTRGEQAAFETKYQLQNTETDAWLRDGIQPIVTPALDPIPAASNGHVNGKAEHPTLPSLLSIHDTPEQPALHAEPGNGLVATPAMPPRTESQNGQLAKSQTPRKIPITSSSGPTVLEKVEVSGEIVKINPRLFEVMKAIHTMGATIALTIVFSRLGVQKSTMDMIKSEDRISGQIALGQDTKRQIAEVVYVLSVIPGGRAAFERDYSLSSATTDQWLKSAGLVFKELDENIMKMLPQKKVAPTPARVTKEKPTATPMNEVSVKDNDVATSELPSTHFSLRDSIKTALSNAETDAKEVENIPYPDILAKVGLVVNGDKEMIAIWKRAARYAKNPDINMLVRGESGSGKELLPRAIHELGFSGKPLCILNCGASNENLIESDLFGHERGAFTDAKEQRIGAFEEANGGVLVLDEIGDLPFHLQVKLLRAIENKSIRRVGGKQDIPVSCKVIATTHKKIPTMVALEKFRLDLYLRLATAEFLLPALRNREQEHKIQLVYHFVRMLQSKLGGTQITIEEDAVHYIANFAYQGNVREMRDLIVKAWDEAVARDPKTICIKREDAREAIKSSPSAMNDKEEPSELETINNGQLLHEGALRIQRDSQDADCILTKTDLSLLHGNLDQIMYSQEKVLVFEMLVATEGNQSAAAARLGITRGKVRSIMKNDHPHNGPPYMEEYLGSMKFTKE